ncbi:ADP-ribosyltransferase [Krasilnikovia sp. MM14-A1259]|uniref:VG15 protein n=1 Tax=Krasilnikovia sp. MM14-A1259 TaxID=3373539 RepID=UPI00380C2DE4
MTAPVLPTHALTEAYRLKQAEIASHAAAAVALAHKTMLSKADLDQGFAHYATVAGKIINAARASAAAAGAAFYLAHRGAANVRAAMPQIAWAPQLDPAILHTSLLVTGPVAVKRAISMGATIDQALKSAEVKTAGAAYRHTANGGRATIKGTILRDEQALGWARVSDGRPCAFCAMLCSRGAVYESSTTAGLTEEGDKYHDHCGCFVVPVYSPFDPLPGLGPELAQLWQVSTKGKGGQAAVNAFRQAYDTKYPPGTNPSAAIADAQLAAAKSEAATNKANLDQKLAEDAVREAEQAAKAAAEAAAAAERAATAAAGMDIPRPQPDNLTKVGSAAGSHGAVIYEDTQTGRKWVFKSQVDVMVDVDAATAKLAKRVGRPAADTYPFEIDGKSGSIQLMLPGGDAFPGSDSQKIDPEKLATADLLALQKEQVLDWLFANHDAHKSNFVRDADGQLAGIDKGQALKFFGRDRLDWTFHPNEHEPIYNTIYRAFAEGMNVALNDPTEGELSIFIRAVMDLPDDDLKAIFRPYAEDAARRGWLLAGSHWKPGALEPQKLKANDVEVFLDALVARKNRLDADFAALFHRAQTERVKVEEAAKEAAKLAALEKKWKGKPKPAAPTEPQPPKVSHDEHFAGWLFKVKARYTAHSGGKRLADSHNYKRVRAVIDSLDRDELDALLSRKYIDEALHAEALDLFEAIKAAKANATSDADYLKALRSYKNRRTRYRRYLAEWQQINGHSAALRGMTNNVLRHTSFAEGDAWAQANVSVPTGTAKAALRRYSGSDYTPWNAALRKNNSITSPSGTWEQPTQEADAGFSPMPADVIVHRGTGFDEFAFPNHGRTAYLPPPDPRELIGTVQTQAGYMSTSVGHRSAFFSKPVQMIIRLPAGHGGAYVNPYSQFKGEYEMLVQRQTSVFIHDVYQNAASGKWFVEAEVLPMDTDPALFEGLEPHPTPADQKITPSY